MQSNIGQQIILTQSGSSTSERIAKPCLLQMCIPNTIVFLTPWFSPPQVPLFLSVLRHCLSSHHAVLNHPSTPPFPIGLPKERAWGDERTHVPCEPHRPLAGQGTQASHRLHMTPRPCILCAFVVSTYLTNLTEIKREVTAWEWEDG